MASVAFRNAAALLLTTNAIVCVCFTHSQISDCRRAVTPGGHSVQRLIGNAPLVIRHEGRVHTPSKQSSGSINETMSSDTSMAAGDVSIQAVFDVRRMP